jgi:hypothetical protein
MSLYLISPVTGFLTPMYKRQRLTAAILSGGPRRGFEIRSQRMELGKNGEDRESGRRQGFISSTEPARLSNQCAELISVLHPIKYVGDFSSQAFSVRPQFELL